MTEQPIAIARAREQARGIDPARLPGMRSRLRWTLFAMSALGSTGYIAAITVGTLVAAEIHGDATLGGVPTAAATVGTATAATLLSGLMLRVGRRAGLLGGLVVGVVGAILAVGAVVADSIVLLLVASALTGFANGVGNLGRYVAADLVPPERRASAIGMVVWGSTIGAVSGPNLVAPAGTLADALGLPTLAGAYVLTVGFIGLAAVLAFVMLRPEPYALADPSALELHPDDGTAPSLLTIVVRPRVLVALVTLVAGQVVMVLIMTMTPIHLTDHGHGLSTVGFVLSAHTFGMFALSPISGRLTDRFGSPSVIGAGLATLGVAALLAALAPPDGGLLLTLALFLLGYGWNLGFVAGSAMLTRGLALAERTRVQGLSDGLVWSSGAVASLSSGVVVAGASYTALGFLGLGLLLVPATLLLARRAPMREA
ncbi:MAG TPA: MFS transporter [Candidatus Limnocylindria bacterium]|nr:MFS transporter [Candidatus Limnocylindria bacterium]